VNVLLVPAHPGFPGQIPQSRKTVVLCVCVCYSRGNCGMLTMSVGALQGQTEDSLQQQLMNLLSDKSSYEAATKVQLHMPDRSLLLLNFVSC